MNMEEIRATAIQAAARVTAPMFGFDWMVGFYTSEGELIVEAGFAENELEPF